MTKKMFDWTGTNNAGVGGQDYTSSYRIKDNADGTQSVIVAGEGVGGKMVWKITPDSVLLEGVTTDATVRATDNGIRFSGESVGGKIVVDGVDGFEFVKGANRQNIESDIAAVEAALIDLGVLGGGSAAPALFDEIVPSKTLVKGLSDDNLDELIALTGHDFGITDMG